MGEYRYANDTERKETQKYEGLYSHEEIELNKRLYDECSRDMIDLAAVRGILEQGADPLGPTAEYGWDVLEHIYGELVSDSQENDSVNLPQITELFLKYGMDVERPRIPYDGKNSIDPLWEFAFVTNENAIYAFKMLLDKGISSVSFNSFFDHAVGDLVDVYCGDPVNDEFWNYTCTWTLKMIMLAASYDHILNENEQLRAFIGYSYNDYDIHKFRNWERYCYEYDTSHCIGVTGLLRSVVTVYEADTRKSVWKFGVYLDKSEFTDD